MLDKQADRIKGPKPKGWWWAENAVWAVRIGAQPKLVYLYLRRRAGSDGQCFPSLRLIAEETELSRSTVRRALATLENEKLLKIKSGQVGKTPNLYVVLRPRVPRGNSPVQTDTPREPQDVAVGHGEAHEGPDRNLLSGLCDPRSTAPEKQDTAPEKGGERRSRAVVMSDDRFLDALKKNSAYKGIDVDREMGKLDAWLLTPAGRDKKKTRARVVRWLNKCDVVMGPSKTSAAGQPVIRIPDLPPEIAALVVESKKSEPGTSLADLVEKARRELRRRKEAEA